jgi:signal transduction histidine kinase
MIEIGGNTFSTSHSDDLGIIRTDETKLTQIVLNLLSNAGKFTSDGSVEFRISNHYHNDVESVIIEVRDTGIGMTQEEQTRLFKDFSQADISTTKRYGGTGLGLSLSKRFAAMLQGEIWVDSKKGVGSTFCVRLPVFIDEDVLVGVPVESGQYDI